MVFGNVPKLHGLVGGGLLVAASALPIGCGEDKFSGCEASRTCPGSGGDSGTGGASDDAGASGEGGAGSEGGSGGSPECTRHADCSDGNDANGAERCRAGSCEPGNPPPAVESVTPLDGEEDVEMDATISIEFSEPLDPDTVTEDSIHVSVGGTPIAGEIAYDDETTVTFTPSERLYLLSEHVVTVTTDVTDAAGAALLEPFESTFQGRDGAWSALGALPGSADATMPQIVAVGAGDLLLAWSSPTGIVARWYRSAGGWGDVEPVDGCQDCTSLKLAGNRAGVAMLAYASGTRVVAWQYREGAWEADGQEVADAARTDPWFSIAVSPIGEAHVLVARGSDGVLVSRSTDETGAWRDQDESASNVILDVPTLAFDANGDGLATWVMSDSIRVAEYDQTDGTWSSPTSIPSSDAMYLGPTGLAFGEAGNAMAAWTSSNGNPTTSTRIVASAYSDGTWSDPTPLNGANEGMPGPAPQLVFDGSDFIAAWTETRSGGVSRVYTSRYTDGNWQPAEPRDTQSAGTNYYWMPHLGVDAVGNLQLSWRSATTEPNWDEVMSSRYTHASGSWSAPKPPFSALIHLDDRSASLAVSPNGVSAALLRYQLQDFSGSRTSVAVFE